jgi:cell division protein FtsZ
MNDARMDNRVQVIMVITGLGATPVEQPAAARPQKEAAPVESAPVEAAPAVHAQAQPAAAPTASPRERSHIEFVPSPADLDLPAFMRRRVR